MTNNFRIAFSIRNLAALLLLFLFITDSRSQILLIENFNYPAQDSILGHGNWFRAGNPLANKVIITNPGLSYPGYISSDIGSGSVSTNVAEGQGIIRSFTQISSGTVYMSFMLRIGTMGASTTEGFFICLDQFGGPTNFNTKVYFKKLTPSTFNLGIQKYTGSKKYSSTVFNSNTTYLVVCSYTFVPGDNNDVTNLYAFASGVPPTQPASPLVSDNESMDVADIGDIVIVNSFIQNTMTGTEIKIDGLRIGSSWSSVFTENISSVLTLKSFIQGFYDETMNKMVKDTVRVVLRYPVAPYLIADSSKALVDSAGTGVFYFNRVGMNSTYFVTASHRNTIETWSNTPKEISSLFTMNCNFPDYKNNVFGGNQILKGSRYCMYNGDANRDNSVNLTDVVAVYNNTTSFSTGYLKTDMDGNNVTNLADLILTYNNAINFVGTITP